MSALLDLKDISVHFAARAPWFGRPTILRAVENVSLKIGKGETLALVGESGSGKTTLGHVVAGLRKPTAGSVTFAGAPVQSAGAAPIQMVFQDPFSALDPRMLVGEIVAEPLRLRTKMPAARRLAKAAEIIAQVGLPPDSVNRYPHEFSGGQRQRIAIARALVSDPELIVADEPLSALDVSVQSQVLNLMKDIQDARGLSYLFISHDLAVVNHLADRVAVLYLGRIMEIGAQQDLFSRPGHPYTRALLESLPRIGRGKRKPGQGAKGEIPSPLNPPSGCVFHTRCPRAEAICLIESPTLLPIESEDHQTACHFRGRA